MADVIRDDDDDDDDDGSSTFSIGMPSFLEAVSLPLLPPPQQEPFPCAGAGTATTT